MSQNILLTSMIFSAIQMLYKSGFLMKLQAECEGLVRSLNSLFSRNHALPEGLLFRNRDAVSLPMP